MYGADIERLLGVINQVYLSAQSAVTSMAEALDRQLFTMIDSQPVTITPGSHGHPDGSHSHNISTHRHYENAVPSRKPEIPDKTLREELKRLKQVEGKLYTPRQNLNTCIGSPYSELDNLTTQLDIYLDQPSAVSYLGQQAAVGLLAQNVASSAINAKFAVIQYHDGLQRGYDACINGGKASITWDDFNKGTSTGDIKK